MVKLQVRGYLMCFALIAFFSGTLHGAFVNRNSVRASSHRLSDTGLGGKIHLIDLVDDSFAGTSALNGLEVIPKKSEESLHQEPVPPEFRNRGSFGQFTLASSLAESGGGSRQVDFLTRMVDGSTGGRSQLIQRHEGLRSEVPRRRSTGQHNALLDSERGLSGASSVDFAGSCVEGYAPFAKESAESLEACWSECRGNFACTQIHFNEVSEACFLSHGISTRGSDTSSSDGGVCRSLTPAGVATLNQLGLPPFQVLPNNKVMLVFNQTASPNQVLAGSLAECQSACLQFADCSFGVWLDKANEAGSECIYGHDLAPAENSICPPGSECMRVCGTADCMLFARNVNNMVAVPGLSRVDAFSIIPTSVSMKLAPNTVSCEVYCGANIGSEDPCLTLCLADKRALCQGACAALGDKCVSVGFAYGNSTEQACTGFTAIPNVNVTSNFSSSNSSRLVEVFVSAPFAVGSIPHSLMERSGNKKISRLSKFLAPSDVRPKFSTFTGGACAVFHEGLLMGSGPGLSQFAAQSLEECWGLCESFGGVECSQVHYHAVSKECVLGDAIATDFRPNPAIVCRSLDYLPTQTSNGLSGMLFVDSVGDQKWDNTQLSWFGSASEPVLVGSLEECQALCKQADTDAPDAVCRFGGFVECTSFHSTACRGVDGSHPDCGLCDRNPAGGVCRIPKIPPPVGSSSDFPSTPLSCLGGQCRWFERSATGFSVQVKTPSNENIDFTANLICDNPSYLPVSHAVSPSDCFYNAESLWHCQELCHSVNRLNGSGSPACVGGLYKDAAGVKECRLARFRKVEGAPCAGAGNCAWFELGGLGHTAGLEVTGMTVASKAREISTLPFIIGKGRCAQFKALEAVISNTPSGFQFSPIEDCARACAFFPQCMAFQVAGSVTGAAGACDVTLGKSSDCTFVTCSMSSALTLPVPAESNSTLCWSKTPSGTVDIGPASIDMEGVDPGIPGFIVMNARVRKFSWDNVVNKANLALVPTLEECQSLCRTSDNCRTGNWQPCQSIEQYCGGTDLPGTPQELISTCDACRNVRISEAQPSVQFPENLGVCKLADQVALHSEGCYPEPCYSFEAGLDDFHILSMTKSPFLLSDGSVDALELSFSGTPQAYMKTKSLTECEEFCDKDPNCKYGQFNPRTVGYGECYLTGVEVRIDTGQEKQLKSPQKCHGTCLVFIKLTSTLPPSMLGSS